MEEVMDRFKRLFDANDPNKGGSFYLQSKILRARERLGGRDTTRAGEGCPGIRDKRRVEAEGVQGPVAGTGGEYQFPISAAGDLSMRCPQLVGRNRRLGNAKSTANNATLDNADTMITSTP